MIVAGAWQGCDVEKEEKGGTEEFGSWGGLDTLVIRGKWWNPGSR
jgi:hypothetical protein